MSQDTPPLSISVTELVDFSARCGNLFDDIEGPSGIEGIRAHQRVQKARGEPWQKEYSLNQKIIWDGQSINLHGRIDLICQDLLCPIIEEIKTSYYPPDQLPAAKKKLHWAQVKVYAYLYLLEREKENEFFEQVDLRVTWCVLSQNKSRHQKTHTQSQHYERQYLQDYCLDLIRTFLNWQSDVQQHRCQVSHNAKELNFIYPQYRPGQHQLSSAIFRSIRDQQQLLVEAPTGIGKTISTLFPAIKSLGEEHVQGIAYLTGKNSTKQLAQQCIEQMIESGLEVSYVTLQAKEHACPCKQNDNEGYINDEGQCRYTLGFYDRLPEARSACLQEQRLSPQKLNDIAHKYQLCPFALSQIMAPWVSICIADINYAFDPLMRLSLFDKTLKRVVLIDEAHNLSSRARAMYSAKISTEENKKVIQTLSNKQKKTKKKIQALNQTIISLGEQDNSFVELPSTFREAIDELIDIFHEDSVEVETETVDEQYALWKNNIYRVQKLCDIYHQSHICIIKRNRKDFHFHIFCRDATSFLLELNQQNHSTIAFSATLSPTHYFREITGLEDSSQCLTLAPVFPPSNQLTLHCSYIDTRWNKREQSLAALVELVARVTSLKAGKYLVFLPSYDYLDKLREYFLQLYPTKKTVWQQRGSDEATRKEFLQAFFDDKDPVIGFAILGGVFAEGVDFIGDALSGCIIVGTGMPQPSEENKLMAAYLDNQGHNSFQYLYQYPGITRIIQTAGRLIRSEQDKGIVILVDPRFQQTSYRHLLPPHWNILNCTNLEQAVSSCQYFWQHAHQDT